MKEEVTDLTRGVYRRLYAGFIKGQRINKLSLQAEAWFWRVLTTVDDFGNGEADPELCRAATVGRRTNVTKAQIGKWLDEMEAVKLISFYSVKGEKYLNVLKFESWQPAGKNGRRIKRFPAPEEASGNPGESKIIRVSSGVVSASENTNEDDNDNNSKNDNETGRNAPLVAPFSGQDFISALAAYDATAKQRKVKESPEQRRLLFKKLAGWGEMRATRALEDTVANGWRGVFEPKENTNGNYQQNPSLQGSSGSNYKFKSKTVIR